MPPQLRAARAADTPVLQAIERLAGERFRAVGLDAVADDEPPSRAELVRHAIEGRSFVVVLDAGEPLGYVLVGDLDGRAHIEQMSVRPEHQGRGLSRLLLEGVRSWATRTGRGAITLTTFAHVPWNRPLYEHLGFRTLGEEEIGPELLRQRAAETEHGLDPALRVCMILELRD